MYLLDTNVISELRKVGDGKADANVVQWVSSIDAASSYLSVVTIMELEIGILRIRDGMTVVTRNLSDFKNLGVQLINPWGS